MDHVIDLIKGNSKYLHSGGSILLGLDTEIIARDQQGNLIYPHDHACAQERPKYGDRWHSFGGVDWHGDGFAWELCVDPRDCIENMVGGVQFGLSLLTKTLCPGTSEISTDTLHIEAPAVYEVPQSVVESAPADVKRLGCARSLNIHGAEATPSSLGDNIRTTGCHLHLSHSKIQREHIGTLIAWADVLVGNTWTMISPLPSETEAFRRTAYGKAGEHRYARTDLNTFRVEYRVLPGYVALHPAYLSMMYALYRQSLHLTMQGLEPPQELLDYAASNINSANQKEAKKLYKALPWSSYSKRLLNFYTRNRLAPMPLSRWRRGVGFRYFYRHQQNFRQGGLL